MTLSVECAAQAQSELQARVGELEAELAENNLNHAEIVAAMEEELDLARAAMHQQQAVYKARRPRQPPPIRTRARAHISLVP